MISNIEEKNGWYYIYDETGHKSKTLSDNIGEIMGVGNDWFIVAKNGWYYLYDEDGRRYKTLSDNIGEIVNVSGNTFVVRKSGWLHTYDKDGNKIYLERLSDNIKTYFFMFIQFMKRLTINLFMTKGQNTIQQNR